jgi:16S rRNA pseudouridine516 synthase
MADRLDAFLSHRGFGSRSVVRGLVRSGTVTLNGKVCRDQSARVDGREVSVKGEVVPVGVYAATLILNKPRGYACSHDTREAPLVDELVPKEFAHLQLQCAGRLDRDTSGLIVITTDGELIHSLTNPRRHVLKRYRITYTGHLSHHAVARCAKGIKLPEDPRLTLPARLELDEVTEEGPNRATMLMSEGRYHQVRRMIHELGGEVVALHRDRIGALEIPADLASGVMREITDAERHEMMRGLVDDEGEDEGGAQGAHGDEQTHEKDPPQPQLSMRELLAQRTTKPRSPLTGARGPQGPERR